MKLNHFETPEATMHYAVDTALWDLFEDLARMTGSEAERYSDEECAALEDKIADIASASHQ